MKYAYDGEYPYYNKPPWDDEELQPFDFEDDFPDDEEQQYALWAKQLREGY